MKRWLVAWGLVVSSVLLGARPARAQEAVAPQAMAAAPAADGKAQRPFAAWRWYGWQPLLLDVGAGALFAFDATSERKSRSSKSLVDARHPLAAIGASVFVMGPPVTHLANGRYGVGLMSFGLRIALPLAGLAAAQDMGGSEQSRRAALAMTMVSASLIDAALLSWKRKPQKRAALAPSVAWDGARSASVGVAGAF